MHRSLWLRRVAAATTLALLATACGGGDDEPSTDDETETEAPADDGAEEEPTDDDGTDDGQATSEGDGVLQLGYILPESGDLSFLGGPMIGAVELALADINGAGGVLGSEVTLATGDEANDATLAAEAAQRLIGEGVDAIVGAAASGMSLAIVDAVTGAGVLQCSPSNTAPTFTANDYNGLYARTAPTDALQGPVIAEAIVAAGNTSPALLGRADDYGQGLVQAIADELEAQGASIAAELIYDPAAANYESEVNQVVDSGADSVVVVGFEEGAQIIQGLIEAGMGPQDVDFYTADGMASNETPGSVDPNNPAVLEGMIATRAATDASPDFLTRFQDETGVEDTTYAPQAYDCMMLMALAAEAAGSDVGSDIAGELVNVTTGDTECSTFEECKAALENGDSIAYQAVSGVVLTETETGNLEPESSPYEVLQFTADGELEQLEVVQSNF